MSASRTSRDDHLIDGHRVCLCVYVFAKGKRSRTLLREGITELCAFFPPFESRRKHSGRCSSRQWMAPPFNSLSPCLDCSVVSPLPSRSLSLSALFSCYERMDRRDAGSSMLPKAFLTQGSRITHSVAEACISVATRRPPILPLLFSFTLFTLPPLFLFRTLAISDPRVTWEEAREGGKRGFSV